MSVHALDFGTTHAGQPAHIYRLRNAAGMEVDVSDIGASIVSVRVPDGEGGLVDVALGFDDPDRYEHNTHAMGGVVGRFANRIALGTLTIQDTAANFSVVCTGVSLQKVPDRTFDRQETNVTYTLLATTITEQ